MVVQAIVQLAIALPTGLLFGLGYGTAIRIGYEQIYPLLFGNQTTPQTVETTLAKMTEMYDVIGGKEANAFGINQGIKEALKAIEADPELIELIKKNSNTDSLNITVTKSGDLLTDSGLVASSSPPSSQGQFDDLKKQIYEEGKNPSSRMRAALDEACASKHGTGSKWSFSVSPTSAWCKLRSGALRELDEVTEQTDEQALIELRQSQGEFKQPTIPKQTDTKRAAGQTQKLERTRLIRRIQFQVNKINGAISTGAAFVPNNYRPLRTGRNRMTSSKMAEVKSVMFSYQQQLVNLISKYKF